MISMTRCKLATGSANSGEIGSEIHMSAVYEGSEELQKISENAIFGWSSPSGSLSLVGAVPAALQKSDEYYVDLYPGGTAIDQTGYVLVQDVHKAYQSSLVQKPNQQVNFRFVSTTTHPAANFSLGVLNPPAVAFLAAHDTFVMAIKRARGRVSDREIAVRQKMVDDFKVRAETDSYYQANPKVAEIELARLERKLGIAKGDVVD